MVSIDTLYMAFITIATAFISIAATLYANTHPSINLKRILLCVFACCILLVLISLVTYYGITESLSLPRRMLTPKFPFDDTQSEITFEMVRLFGIAGLTIPWAVAYFVPFMEALNKERGILKTFIWMTQLIVAVTIYFIFVLWISHFLTLFVYWVIPGSSVLLLSATDFLLNLIVGFILFFLIQIIFAFIRLNRKQ